MSSKGHTQVQWVPKDSTAQTTNPKKRSGSHHPDKPQPGHARKPSGGTYHKQQNWRKPKQPLYQPKPVNDAEHQRYDVKTMVSVFNRLNTMPPELQKFKDQFPTFFQKKSVVPLNIQETPLKESSDEEPLWMQEDDLEQDANNAFNFDDIESLLDEKRVAYQKEHGTFEKKQQEKEEKLKAKQEKEKQEQELLMEKQKYIQMKEERKQTQSQQQSLQQSHLVSDPLQDLFKLAPQSLVKDETPEALTVEQLEKQLHQRQEPKQEPPIDIMSLIPQAFIQQSQIQVPIVATPQQVYPVHQSPWQARPPPQSEPRKPLVPPEMLEKQPFSTLALLQKTKVDESAWYYVDQQQQVQGSFTSMQMDIWNQQGYFVKSLMISWKRPTQWLSLESFLINLMNVNRGILSMDRVFEQQQVSQIPGLEYQFQKLLYDQQQQNDFMKYYPMPQQNINISNNVYNIGHPIHSKKQQYYQPQLKKANSTNTNQKREEQPKPVEQQQPQQIFGIGSKKNSQPSVQNVQGIQIDSKEFPSLGHNN